MLWILLATTVAVLPPPQDSPEARARLWLEVVRIRESSFESLSSRDIVRTHLPDGSSAVLVEADVDQDVFRRVRLSGTKNFLKATNSTDVGETIPLQYTLCDGVLRGLNPQDRYVVVRPETPSSIDVWTLPGPAMGLGFGVNLSEMKTRADYLAESKGLRVVEEDSERVVIEGYGNWANRWLVNRLELDASTGDVRTLAMRDMIWDAPFVEWRMAGWIERGGRESPRVRSTGCSG
jgi:hypothetical protein